jgi:hypothetical protein
MLCRCGAVFCPSPALQTGAAPPRQLGRPVLARSAHRIRPQAEVVTRRQDDRLVSANGNLFVKAAGTGGKARLVRASVSPDGASRAPDSRKLVVVVRSSTGPYRIEILSLRGRTTRRLVRSSTPLADPDWSPNGREVVFAKQRRDGRFQLLCGRAPREIGQETRIRLVQRNVPLLEFRWLETGVRRIGGGADSRLRDGAAWRKTTAYYPNVTDRHAARLVAAWTPGRLRGPALSLPRHRREPLPSVAEPMWHHERPPHLRTHAPMPESHSPELETWLDEEISSLLEGVGRDPNGSTVGKTRATGRAGMLSRAARRLPNALSARASVPSVRLVRDLGRELRVRSATLGYCAVAALLGLLVGWLTVKVMTP